MSTTRLTADDFIQDQDRQQFELLAAKCAIPWTSSVSKYKAVTTTRAVHTATPPNADAFTDVQDLIGWHAATERASDEHVCVIENMSLEWILALGKAWVVHFAHFIYHLRNHGNYPAWASALERAEAAEDQTLQPRYEIEKMRCTSMRERADHSTLA